jgi:peptidyl-dipeptidase Dcp
MLLKASLALVLSFTVVAPSLAAGSPEAAANPFFTPSPLPFAAPPFDRISDGDFQPAIEEGMRQHLAEIEAIADDPAPPTFANTIELMEGSGELLTRALKVFGALAGANTDETIQKVQGEEAPKLAAHQDSIFLNPKLFARVEAIYNQRDDLGLDPVAKYLVERYHRFFVRAGAELSEADKTRLRALNQEESTLTTQFHDRVLADTNALAVVVDDPASLAGLSDAAVAAAASQAEDRGLAGKWVLSLQNTTRQPTLASLTDRGLRNRLFDASAERGDHSGANDTRGIVSRLAELRAEKAKLLGYPSFAAYVLDDQMAKTPAAAEKLLTDLVPAATAKAREEAARIQSLIDSQGGDFAVGPQDWELYGEQVRKAEFDLDDAATKPYFELDRVLHDGVFYAAHELYGLSFKERTDIPVYQSDVRVFEVSDADGSPLALFYGDYFSRPAKSGGAWMDSFVDQSGLLRTKPVVFNVTNFTKPAAGQPALLTYTEVTTLFHEFGHALHGMLSDVRYPSLAGTSVPRDFVEFPSQFNEHWALDPKVLPHYAVHYQTGAPMPPELMARIKKSRTFNQGYDLTEYLAAALLDLAWHTLPAGAPPMDADVFEAQSLRRFGVDLVAVPPRYHTTYFSHIWDGGYAAGYYAYLWSEVIDDDAYAWFKENGGLTRANGQRFRDMLLSRGGTADAAALYRAFRGREPSIEPLLEERGLKPAGE